MSAGAHAICRVKMKESTSTLFDRVDDVDMTSGTLHELHGDGVPTLETDFAMLPHNRLRQRLFERPAAVRGMKRWRLRLRTPLTSHGQTGDISTLVTPTALGAMLRVAFGGESYHTAGGEGAGSTIASGEAVGGCVVDTNDGDRFIAGRGILIPVSSRYFAREIKSRSTDTLTWKQVLASAPANAAAVYGGITYYPSETLSRQMHFLLLRADAAGQYKCCNGQMTAWAITVEPNGVVMTDQTWEGYGWDYTSGVTLVGGTYSERPIVAMDSEFIISPTAGTTRVLPNPPRTTFNIARQLSPWESSAGENGCVKWVQVGASPAATGSFFVVADSAAGAPHNGTYRTYWEDGTTLQIGQQIGFVGPGRVGLLSFPTVEIINVQPGEVGGIAGEDVSWQATIDAVISGSDEISDAPWRYHQL